MIVEVGEAAKLSNESGRRDAGCGSVWKDKRGEGLVELEETAARSGLCLVHHGSSESGRKGKDRFIG